ncbi:WUSCHEL-related homeobox 14-like, partial [Olea europaea var. sylvestris]|uniref:WUSCHEL-related homeobox 14-like n=1 Tax=Olea europaea var. sylvestris TaxID=158386 RepID=UPI000C1D2483
NTMSKRYWTPTSAQLQVLEYIFNQENKTPNKSRIMQLVSELSLHGQISYMNVYNWFKSRCARLRRMNLSTQAHDSELVIQPMYACRKTLADSWPRVRGRFAKNDELGEAARTAGSNHEEDTDED